MTRREVAIILLPEGVDPCNVRSPDGSYVQHVWFYPATVAGDSTALPNALSKAGAAITRRVDEQVS